MCVCVCVRACVRACVCVCDMRRMNSIQEQVREAVCVT